MKYELKRISVWSAVKIAFVLNLIIGFIFGLFYALILLFLTALPMSMMGDESMGLFPAFAGVAALLLPFFFAFFFAVIYSVIVAIIVFAYNVVVKMTGGIELELLGLPETVRATPEGSRLQTSPGGEQQSPL